MGGDDCWRDRGCVVKQRTLQSLPIEGWCLVGESRIIRYGQGQTTTSLLSTPEGNPDLASDLSHFLIKGEVLWADVVFVERKVGKLKLSDSDGEGVGVYILNALHRELVFEAKRVRHTIYTVGDSEQIALVFIDPFTGWTSCPYLGADFKFEARGRLDVAFAYIGAVRFFARVGIGIDMLIAFFSSHTNRVCQTDIV